MTYGPCQLCQRAPGIPRDGRLGRYALTCDGCEGRRGSHLRPVSSGYDAIDRLPSSSWTRTTPLWATSLAATPAARRRGR